VNWRKHGVKLKLAGQPLEVLTLLLRRPGELVTREELERRLWPHDTVVDFEFGVNTAIYKLRLALGDDSETPAILRHCRAAATGLSPVEVIAAPIRGVPAADRPCPQLRHRATSAKRS